MLKNVFLTLLTIFSALIMWLCIVPYSSAEDLVNQTASSNLTNIANTTVNNPKEDKANRQEEEIKNFFKDADYEHFAPEKSFQFIDPSYLEKP